ncbi:MAG: glycosyltransferase [Patescibacteria group bacterium]|nr:glycosyltransferase [Patescibacteria group bacterium]MDD5715421.1 glycosyltransferase [Patescibacteria group bacterium]
MISIIVPVFNGERTIERCLKSLFHQTLPRDRYEIIVIDDGSSDATARVVRKFSGVRYCREPNRGPAAARNCGARQASGDILLFIDADCEADRQWAEEMAKPFADASVQAVKGVYRTKQPGIVARLVQVEFEERYDKMARSKGLDFMDFSAGAIRAEVFRSLEGFDEKLRMSEDVQLAYKLSEKQHRIVFTRSAIVYHDHPTKFMDYLRIKFWRSYWRMDVYKNYPRKLLRDSYTPQTLKAQIIGFFGTCLTAVVLPLIPEVRYALIAEVAILIALVMPLTVRGFRVGFIEGALAPFFIIGRAFALGFGVLYYFLEIKNARELMSVIMLALVAIVPSFFTGGRDLFAQTFIFVMAFAFLFFVIRSGKQPLQGKIPFRFNIILPLALLLLVMLASILYSVSPYDSYAAFMHWVPYLALFFGTVYLITSHAEAQKIGALIVLLAVILSIIGIYFFLQTQFFGYLRAISTFYQHNPFAGFLLYALPLAFSFLLFAETTKRRIAYGALMALFTLTFVLTYSRGAWLSSIVPLGVVLFFSIQRKRKILRTILTIGMIALIVVAGRWALVQVKEAQAQAGQTGTAPSTVAADVGFSSETPEENAVTARLHFWQGALDSFRDHPIIGTGLETYKILYRQYLTDIRYYSIDPHNIYLKFFTELGIVGGIVFVWFVGSILFVIGASLRQIHQLTRKTDQALMLGLSMGLLGALTHGFVELDWQFPTNLIIFFITLGCVYKLFLIQRGREQPAISRGAVGAVYSGAVRTALPAMAALGMLGGLLLFASSTLQTAGIRQMEDLEYDAALSSLKTAQRLDPLNYDLHYGLAQAYYLATDAQNVSLYRQLFVSEFERTISLSSHDWRPYERLGRYYLLAKDYAAAERYLKRGIELNPIGKPVLYFLLSSAYAYSDRIEEARVLLEDAVSRYDPSLRDSQIWVVQDREEILYEIGLLHGRLGHIYDSLGDTESAAKHFGEAAMFDKAYQPPEEYSDAQTE